MAAHARLRYHCSAAIVNRGTAGFTLHATLTYVEITWCVCAAGYWI
jgi:hypothetical protein